MINLIKYLWATYGPKKKTFPIHEGGEQPLKSGCITFTDPDIPASIIFLADLLEKDGLCQTIEICNTDSAVIEKTDINGNGIKYHDILGPKRIIIIKENDQ